MLNFTHKFTHINSFKKYKKIFKIKNNISKHHHGINPDNIIKYFYSKDIIKPLRKGIYIFHSILNILQISLEMNIQIKNGFYQQMQ